MELARQVRGPAGPGSSMSALPWQQYKGRPPNGGVERTNAAALDREGCPRTGGLETSQGKMRCRLR